MTPDEFAQVQRNIKEGLALNAELQHQQVMLLKDVRSLLRGALVVGGLVVAFAVIVLASVIH